MNTIKLASGRTHDNTSGANHSWSLMEISTSGSTSDTFTLGQVGTTQTGTTVTFTGLSKTKSYYIKHNVSGDCINLTESRLALPQTLEWEDGYTANFVINLRSLGNNVTVDVIPNSNPGFVFHQWSIYYAPNGNTTGNTMVPQNPVVSSETATFSNNLVTNEWYYIKHGIWNDCFDWAEVRKEFKIIVKRSESGKSEYVIETRNVDESIKTKVKESSKEAEKTAVIFPNPISRGELCTISSPEGIEKVIVKNTSGKRYNIKFKRVGNKISFLLDDTFSRGIYFVYITKKDGTSSVEKMIVD